MSDDRNLAGAYALKTPEDSVRLYGKWAETYDDGFAATHHYAMHQHVAATFLDAGGAGPVLDVGAGTGLVTEALKGHDPKLDVDGIDISQEMLDIAGGKGIYRNRICADLTTPLKIADASYAGFVSAGTFTHGHVGPVCLPELLRIARPGAVFVISIKTEVFDGAGFGSAFADLVADGEISPLNFRRIRIYDEAATHDHADDRSLLAIFRRV